MKRKITPEPVLRGRLRMWLGVRYFRARRWVRWHVGGTAYARRRTAPDCPHLWMAHATPLVRRFRDVDLWMQENKVRNLRLAAARLDGVITKIKRVMQSALAKIQKTLMQPEVKKVGKEQIKEKARESIRDKLAKDKLDADRDNRERWEREGRIAPTKKHDMEL